MKTKYLFLTFILIMGFSLIIIGQTAQRAKSQPITRQKDVASVMGKPIYESTVDSLNTKVWIITQKKFKSMINTQMGKMMSKMKETNKERNKATKDSMMMGTHYIIFDVTNIVNKKEFADSSAKVEIVSPTKVISSVLLLPMMNHFGSGVFLKEKGNYLFTINLNVGMGYKTSQFKYKVK